MILHLMTQRGQPYGNERRCCEHCGLMLVWRDAEFWRHHRYVDDEAGFHANHPIPDLRLCTDKDPAPITINPLDHEQSR